LAVSSAAAASLLEAAAVSALEVAVEVVAAGGQLRMAGIKIRKGFG